MKSAFIIALALTSLAASANYELSKSKSAIYCEQEDYSYQLNAKRKAIKTMVEGESKSSKIIQTKSDNKTYIIYITEDVTLRLGKKDTVAWMGSDPSEVKCQ